MKKYAALVPLLALLAMPLAAGAHETQMFEINGKTYQFVIGSLNEPIVVDDKTGVDLRISEVTHRDHEAGDHHEVGNAVAGLENSLKVELIAGDKKKTLSLSPVYNTPGFYKATFYPTVATKLTYRVFGELNGTPVDLSFSCHPGGHAEGADDTTRAQISDKVVRTMQSGGFGCAVEKADMGFPEASADVLSLKKSSERGEMIGWGAGALALAALGALFIRRRS